MDQREAVIEHYNGRAATYDESEMHRGLVSVVADFVGEVSGTVIDVATGTGLMLLALQSRHRALSLIGVDLSPGMLNIAMAQLPEATLLLGDAASLAVADGSADLLTCITALHLFSDKNAVAREWARVVRQGGRVVTATFLPVDGRSHAVKPQKYLRRHEDFHSVEQVAALFGGHGFRLDDHQTWTHGNDGLLICAATRLGPHDL